MGVITMGSYDFESNAEPIPQNVENTLERAVRDYQNHWKGVIGEAVQNSIDGYYTNREDRNTVVEDQKLVIELEVDSENNKFVWKDNAGGMPQKIFLEKFPGLDTPGDEKAKGKGMGSWGRGVHVIVGAHDDSGRAIAETKHGEYEGKIEIRKSKYAKISKFEGELETSGTKVEIQNLRPLVLMGLIDWESVRGYIQERFQRALESEEIEIRYNIDGDNRIVQPFDLSEYKVLFEGDLPFGEDGDEKLKDVVIYEKPSDAEIPFEGISMNKTNEYHEDPFMRVKEFTPHTVRNLDRMFGFCDASALCPEHENNAHNDFLQRQAVNRAYAALREKLNELDSEHFLGRQDSVKEKQEIVDEALDRFQDYWGEDNPISLTKGEFQISETEGESSEDDEEDNSGEQFDNKDEQDTQNEKERPNLKLNIGSRVFEVGDTVSIDVDIMNDSQKAVYKVGGNLKDPEGNESDLGESNNLQVPAKSEDEDDPMTLPDLWEIDPNNEGKYVVRAQLVNVEDEEVIYETSTFFYYGVNPFIGSESSSAGINISWAHGDESYRYQIMEKETGLTLYVNMSHPEWKVAVKRDGGSNEHQSTLLARFLQEATMLYRLKDDLGEESEEYLSVKEKFVEKTSEFSAKNYDRYL
jgi:hypothetical protein